MMASRNIKAQFVAFLIEEYKALPSLWEVDSEAYKNKHTKRADYNKLLKTMMAVDPLLTMDELKNKIAKIRTCYRRELKKVSESIKSGAKDDDVYIPTLWYFDQMDFLRWQDQEAKPSETDRLSLYAEDHQDQDECEVYLEEWKPPSPVARNVKIKSRIAKNFKKSFVKKNTFLNKAIKRPEAVQHQNQTNKDEADVFSESWAVLFRKLSHDQKLFAKRCIDEILYQGQLGNLNHSTYRNIEKSFKGSNNSNIDMNSSNC